MNNIYVEGEFSNHCNDCPFYNIEAEFEVVGDEKNYHKCLVGGDIITGNCPLKPLTDRLAEERKKVVQEIDCELYTKMVVYGDAPSYTDIHSILNKIKEKGE